MNYKFPQFNAELIDPKIEDLNASYSLKCEKVLITATLNANGNRIYMVNLGEMENSDEWSDAEVLDFATKELEKFIVK